MTPPKDRTECRIGTLDIGHEIRTIYQFGQNSEHYRIELYPNNTLPIGPDLTFTSPPEMEVELRKPGQNHYEVFRACLYRFDRDRVEFERLSEPSIQYRRWPACKHGTEADVIKVDRYQNGRYEAVPGDIDCFQCDTEQVEAAKRLWCELPDAQLP